MSGTGNPPLDAARGVADAVLLEGYVLYPYRASAPKNQVRWQFGVLAPPGASSSEPSHAQTECLIEPPGGVLAGGGPALEVTVRFLQVQARTGQGADAVAWDEAVVREVPVTARLDPSGAEHSTPFQIDGGEDDDGATVRRRWPLSGVVRVRAERVEGPYGAWRVRVRVENQTPCGACVARTEMLRRSLVSAHTLLHLPAGVFISLLEPPEWAAAAAAACDNQHTWPVLVGEGRRDVMLSSPIILYDYPEIAGESPANLHDSTEIDELLMLRTMTLTDEEKAEARATDQRSADIIDRADHLPPEMMERLHGAIRYLRGPEAAQPGGPGQGLSADGVPEFREPAGPGQDDPGVPWWDPGADSSVSPETDRVPVPGGWASKGAKVRLWPGRTDPGPAGSPVMRRTDAQDMFTEGLTATVQAVLHDVDGSSHLAVTLDDDPAAELHQWFGRYQYFSPSEVELVGEGTPAAGEDSGQDSGPGADAGGPR
jgi:hypothetical protein